MVSSRWDYSNESRINIKKEAISEWIKDNKYQIRENCNEEDEMKAFKLFTKSYHSNIICDKCREKNIRGIRYRCANCRDFDLCENCEEKEYKETLGIVPKSGVLFDCPYPLCSKKEISIAELCDHIDKDHKNIYEIVFCPVCKADGTSASHVQPGLSEHLQEIHWHNHDPESHTFLKIRNAVPHHPKRNFEPLPPFNFDKISGNEMDSQNIIHSGLSCSVCSVSPIVGIAYVCYNCPVQTAPASNMGKFVLCSKCESSQNHHNPSHVFLKFRRRELTIQSMQDIDDGSDIETKSCLFSSIPTRDILYQSVLVGSFGFDLRTE